MSRPLALALFVAMSIPFGIAGHLLSEFAALGTGDRTALSPLHLYLAVLALIGLVVFAFAGRRITEMADALPWRGRGTKFFGLSVGVQVAFVGVTVVAERSPLFSGDVLAGLAAAVLASIAGAFFLDALRKQIVRIAVALCDYLHRRARTKQSCRGVWYIESFVPPAFASFCTAMANRPPPISSR